MNITDEELDKLRKCQSEEQWTNTCSEIKRARKGSYPPDWWKKVKLSGLMDTVLASFSATSDIKVC